MKNMMQSVIRFVKNWTLPVSMLAGILGFLFVNALPLSGEARHGLLLGAEWLQPALIFTMLFLSFNKVDIRQMRYHAWQGALFLLQGLLFVACVAAAHFTLGSPASLLWESAMLCIICPTATAASVVTAKLHGDMAGVVTYTMMSNLLAAVLIPLSIPFLHDHSAQGFFPSFVLILSRVFPTLIFPFLLAQFIRYVFPKVQRWLAQARELPFYLWCVCLPLSIAIAMKTLFHGELSLLMVVAIALTSLITCIGQFALGKWMGKSTGNSVTVGQSFGQKNTAFAIWLAYTFLTPVTSVAGGFYAIWHNLYNAWQLAQQRKADEREAS